MDPIRTALKYALIPLRLAVEVGEHYLAQGEQAEQSEQPSAPEPASKPRPRKAAAKPAPVRTTSPQASTRPKNLDDVALARKVETIIFRDDAVPKGHIDVNSVNGVVWLRGEARTPEMIKDLERQTIAIPEVTAVENKLHLPKTPAPA